MTKKFFFHYNKPKSKELGHNVMTLHYGGACHLVRHLDVLVPVHSKERKHQPRCVMEGRCHEIRIIKDRAIIS